MNYRDPLFSIIIFVVLILISIIFTLVLGRVREKLREKEIEKLIKNFDYIKDDYKNPLNALLLLAKAYEKEGDYEKALKIYLNIQKDYPSNQLLLNIANLYFKAGFLEKSRKILYKILKTNPRNIDALKLLMLVNEKLGEVKENIEILEIFEELGINLAKEKAYAMIKLLSRNDCKLADFCEGIKTFEDIYTKYPFVKREYIDYLFKTEPRKAYEILDIYEHLDLYWHREDIPNNKKFCNVLAAKKKAKCNKKAPFEIEAMKYLPLDLAELEFEYLCKNCKKVFPIYSTRCPACNELFAQKLIIKLSPKKDIENIEF